MLYERRKQIEKRSDELKKACLPRNRHLAANPAFRCSGGLDFLFVVGNIFGVQILKPGSAISEMLWHLFFWATDFFFVAFRVDPILLDRGAARRCASIDAEHPVLPLCGAI